MMIAMIKIKRYIHSRRREGRSSRRRGWHHLVLPPVSVQMQRPVILEVEVVLMKETIEGDEEVDWTN
jgi:hypothetical protein